ncbi:MAG: hypothetical protein HY645_06710 [Acidobacteria bacterium]|nr:hypothetical protein [Acidobacteriota bacterium]
MFLVLLILSLVRPIYLDVSGTWNCIVDWKDGTQGRPVFVLQQKDEKISGTYAGGLGRFSVLGTIKGNDLEMDLDGGRMHVNVTIIKDGQSMTGTARVPKE